MRILINAVSADSGGGWTYLVNVAKELARDPRGHRCRILVRRDRADQLKEFDSDHCRFEAIGATTAARRLLWEQAVLPGRSRGFDLLFCVADLAPLWKPVPTLVSLRNLNIYDQTYYSTARLRLLRSMAVMGLRGIAGALFPSEASADRIGALVGLPPERRHVIPYGIDPSRFIAPSARTDCTPATPYVLLPAAVERHKNLEVVIDALALIGSPDLELWIAGSRTTDPRYADEMLSRARRLGVADRLRLLGSVEYSEIPGLYARATAVVMPSVLETFGHPLLEALIAGVPLVVSDIPVFREIAGDHAWYFQPHDEHALARALESTSKRDGEVMARIESGAAHASRCTWSRYVDELGALFRVVAAS